MIFDASIMFAGFALGFFIGSIIALIKITISWFVRITSR